MFCVMWTEEDVDNDDVEEQDKVAEVGGCSWDLLCNNNRESC